mmetsp:Transcript_21639/g.69064  ORF Transcript_21639/g.69064 Transcript_21639/m.69064 type:complete len:284 (+) Transcript_21639:77-928(+)
MSVKVDNETIERRKSTVRFRARGRILPSSSLTLYRVFTLASRHCIRAALERRKRLMENARACTKPPQVADQLHAGTHASLFGSRALAAAAGLVARHLDHLAHEVLKVKARQQCVQEATMLAVLVFEEGEALAAAHLLSFALEVVEGETFLLHKVLQLYLKERQEALVAVVVLHPEAGAIVVSLAAVHLVAEDLPVVPGEVREQLELALLAEPLRGACNDRGVLARAGQYPAVLALYRHGVGAQLARLALGHALVLLRRGDLALGELALERHRAPLSSNRPSDR